MPAKGLLTSSCIFVFVLSWSVRALLLRVRKALPVVSPLSFGDPGVACLNEPAVDILQAVIQKQSVYAQPPPLIKASSHIPTVNKRYVCQAYILCSSFLSLLFLLALQTHFQKEILPE